MRPRHDTVEIPAAVKPTLPAIEDALDTLEFELRFMGLGKQADQVKATILALGEVAQTVSSAETCNNPYYMCAAIAAVVG